MKKNFEKTHNPVADAPVDPPPDQPSDDELRIALLDAFATDGRFAGEKFDVEIEDGCAILSGSISLEYLRTLADACASAVPGVLVVKNQLDVDETGPMAYSED